MDRNHGDHAAAWDVVANATSLHRRSADTRERGWYVRFESFADLRTSQRHVRFTPNNGRWAAHTKSAFGCRFVSTRLASNKRLLQRWA
jgi:hypothetical protein